LNVDHYYDDLMAMLEVMVTRGFLAASFARALIVEDSVDALLDAFRVYCPPAARLDQPPPA
jgi:hypothetical protein